MPTNLLSGFICLILGLGSISRSYFIDPTEPAKTICHGLGRSFSGKGMKWRTYWGGIGIMFFGVVFTLLYLFGGGR
jgi:hypothetical protein